MLFAVVVVALGAYARLAHLRESLWLDEFGTLWVVEGDLGRTVSRTLEFQAQSPLYYVFPWLAVQLLGESEVALRLPSVLFGLATCLAVNGVGRELAGRAVGVVSALLAWVAPPLVSGSIEARPYALAALATALVLLGFLRAARTGAIGDRALFGAGALLLLYTQYLLAFPVAALALAWALSPALRAAWTPRRALVDAGLLAALAVPALLHVARLAGAPAPASPLGPPQWLIPPALLSVYAVAGLPGLRVAWPDLDGTTRARIGALASACLVPGAALMLLALVAMNLLSFRYLSNLAVPGAVLGALGLVRYAEAGRRGSSAVLAVAALLACVEFDLGRPHPGVGSAPWRPVTNTLRAAVEREPGPILVRSAFVQDDLRASGAFVSSGTLAPVRNPGGPWPAARLVPLTARWLPGPFYDVRIAAELRDEPVFYFVGFSGWLLRGDANFVEELEAWADAHLGGVTVEVLSAEPADEPIVTALRFRRR